MTTKTYYALKSFLLLFLVVSSALPASGQSIVDLCFTSATPGTSFTSGTSLYNNATHNSDLLNWNGSAWTGGWAGANLTLPPPQNNANCRAVFIGSGTAWTTGGESFELQLSGPMVAGVTYSYNFTYVSHGTGSTGAFSPLVYTNTNPTLAGAVALPNLPPVGYAWTTNTYSFTATAAQAGHDVIIIHSGNSSASGSGMVSSMCPTCVVTTSCQVDLGPNLTLCPGQTAVLNATTAGATYLWQNASTAPTFTVSQAGTYYVQINVAGCLASDTVVVTYNTPPAPNLGNDTSLCAGNSLLLNATTAGGSYLWSNGTTNSTLNVTQAGTYWVDVTVNGCNASDTIIVSYNSLPVVNLGPDQNMCAGQSTTLNATTAGATYLWSDGSTNATLNVTQSGTYWVEVTVNGCTSSDTVNIVVNPLPVVNLGPDQTFCAGQSTTLDATTAGATYLWNNNATTATLSVNQAGSYWVQVTTNGCVASDTVVINVNSAPSVDLGPDQSLCAGQSTTLDVTTAGATYLWNDGSSQSTLVVNTAGTYWVEVTTNGCTSSDTVVITLFNASNVNLGPDVVLCDGQSTIFDATNAGATYLWQDGSTASTFTATMAGTYWVDVTINGCTVSDTVNVAVNPVPSVNLGNDTTLCTGTVLTLDATTPGATYLWSTNETTASIDVSQTGQYWVEVTVNGCSVNDTIAVTFGAFSNLNLGADQTICAGASLVLDASSVPGPYVWQDGSTNPTFTATTTGQYWVAALGDCPGADTINILVVDVQASFIYSDNSACSIPLTVDFTSTATTNGAGIVDWAWNYGDLNVGDGQWSSHTYNNPGTFDVSLTVQTAEGCTASITLPELISVGTGPVANFHFTPAQPTEFDAHVDFVNGSSGEISWNWNFGDGSGSNLENPSHLYPDSAGSYLVSLIVTDDAGCMDTALYYVTVLEEIVFFVPNSFTPDGDESNNEFLPIITSGIDVNDYQLLIFDRWGEVIFRANDISEGWDATYLGKKVPVGVYTWKIEFQELATDKRHVVVGHVNVLY